MENKSNVVKIEEAKGNGKQEQPSKLMVKLLQKKDLLEKEFNKLKEDEAKLLEQMQNNNNQLNNLRLQMVQMQGSYKEITDLISNIASDNNLDEEA